MCEMWTQSSDDAAVCPCVRCGHRAMMSCTLFMCEMWTQSSDDAAFCPCVRCGLRAVMTLHFSAAPLTAALARSRHFFTKGKKTCLGAGVNDALVRPSQADGKVSSGAHSSPFALVWLRPRPDMNNSFEGCRPS